MLQLFVYNYQFLLLECALCCVHCALKWPSHCVSCFARENPSSGFKTERPLSSTSKLCCHVSPCICAILSCQWLLPDAYAYGVGTVLQQRAEELLTVSWALRTLTPQERKYSVGEREALACMWACEHWRVYLWGRHFTLQTDHRSLLTLLGEQGTGWQPFCIARWHTRLLEYNYTVEFKKREKNCVANALSRMLLEESVALPEADEAVCVVVFCISHK